MTVHGHNRSGVTLMEVLISIGILAVGLSAVVALIPAGGSEAQRALTETQKANVAIAALEDAITRGILNPSTWTPIAASPYTVMFDPLGSVGSGSVHASLIRETIGGLQYVDPNTPASGLAGQDVFRSGDDLVYSQPSGSDDSPTPVYLGSPPVKRACKGDYSWLASLWPIDISFNSTQAYQLAVLVFRNREVSYPPAVEITGIDLLGKNLIFSWDNPSNQLTAKQVTELFLRGNIVLVKNNFSPGPPVTPPRFRWRRVIYSSINEAAKTGTLMLDAVVEVPMQAAPNQTSPVNGVSFIYCFPGAVGIAERVVRLEEASPWSQ